VESGESVTENVSGSFNTINPEPSVLHLASAHLPDEYSSETRISVEQDSDHRAPVNLPFSKENTGFLHPGDPFENRESMPSSMSHSLDSESDPAYFPSSCSHSSPGSDSSLPCHVDVEPVQEEIPVHDVSGTPGSSASMPDPSGVGGLEVSVRGTGERSTSKPPIECRPGWKELKNTWTFLWAPTYFIKEECSIKDNARLKKVEKRWKKCFHYGPNSLETDHYKKFGLLRRPKLDANRKKADANIVLRRICVGVEWDAKHPDVNHLRPFQKPTQICVG
jgi:hypothetical protein